jgi:hypothetical protein
VRRVSDASRGVAISSGIPDDAKQLDKAAVAWLETIGQDTVATIQNHPSKTIVPAPSPSTGGGRALANLEALVADIHRVELGALIGEGGMGRVHSAEQVALGRAVAVKTLKTDKRNPGAALDLLREAWVTGALEHPNIVPVHALELDGDGIPSIVMKKIAGVEWSALLGNAAEVERRFGARDLLAWNLEILMRVLDALRFAHSLGIVHRDLKPANVMVGDFGEVYLLDWGIAVSLRDDGSGRFPLAAHATQLAGTPSYMAPEMLGREDGSRLGERTDVYLAGAVLCELISGKPPHAGSNMYAVIASVVASRPELPASAPPELARICARAMQAEPEKRFASVDELQRALRDYLGHRLSDVIAMRAKDRLAELTALLAQPDPPRDEIYRMFGACRSGFRDALAVWSGNETASGGLVEATVVVANYELAHNHPQAAVALLGELPEPHPLFATAQDEAVKHANRIAQLETLGRDLDKRIGTRTRAAFVLVFGVAFTILPTVIWQIPMFHDASAAAHAAWAIGMGSALTLAAWWARESVTATVFNRRVVGTFLFMFAIQVVIVIGGALADRPPMENYLWNLLLYTMIAGMLAITVEPFLWPSVPVYIATYLLARRFPDLALPLSSIPNLTLTLLAAYRWRPATFRYTPEERAQRQR